MQCFPEGIPVTKRLFDFVISLILVIVLSPLLLLLSLLVLVIEGGPILFSQERPGYKGKVFRLYKFRSMRQSLDKNGKLLPDEKRISAFGKLLRASSMDELPELFNILKGEMSLVGPRPLLVEYLPRYSSEQARRHDVLPGITGWAQVNGRNAISWQQKFEFDVWYVDHWTFGLDIKILFMTVGKALNREGISQPGRATMDVFMGNEGPEDN